MLDLRKKPISADRAPAPPRALDGVDAGMVVLDDCGVIVEANKAWLEAVEAQGAGERAGRGRHNYLVECDRAADSGVAGARSIAAMIRAMIAGSHDRFVIEYECAHDGEARWFEARGWRTDSRDGRWITISHVDVSERKAREAGDRLAIRELQHRLGNTIALISSLFSVSARHGGTVGEMSVRFQSRLQALAGAHRLLDANGWCDVPLDQVVERTTAAFLANGAIESGGPAVALAANDVLNLALVVHELCTNAVRHGALSRSRGHVVISWLLQDDHVLLVWQERGGPAVKLPKSPGTGSRIIDAAGANMGLRIHRVFHRSGLRVLMRLPRRRLNRS